MKKYFESIHNIGDLYIAETLMEYDNHPILFICRNANNVEYICLCYEYRKSQEWIVKKVDSATIGKMKSGKISIYSVFENGADDIINITFSIDGSTFYEVTSINKLNKYNPLALPDKSVFL